MGETIKLENCIFMGPLTGPCLSLKGVDGAVVASCALCREEVYTDVKVIRNHYFYRHATHIKWVSTDFNVIVHQCTSAKPRDITQGEVSAIQH